MSTPTNSRTGHATPTSVTSSDMIQDTKLSKVKSENFCLKNVWLHFEKSTNEVRNPDTSPTQYRFPLTRSFFTGKAKAKEQFLELLVENSTWIRGDDRWRDVKRRLEDDPRYNRDLLSSDDREDYFEDFIRKLRNQQDAARHRRRDDDAQREREREIRRIKEREERALIERQERLQREQEIAEFRVLLKERLHDSQVRCSSGLFKMMKLI